MNNTVPRVIYPRKRDLVPIYSRQGGLQGQSGRMRIISSQPEFDPLDRPARL